MANERRQVSIFINGREVENTIKGITAEKAKLNRELNRMNIGSAEYESHIKQIGRLDNTLSSHRQKLSGIESSYKGLTAGATKFLGAAGIAFGAEVIISGLVNVGREMVTLYDQAAKTDAQLKAALKSTGEVAGRSFEQLNAQAEQLQKFTLFDDDATKQAQALLVTFTKVRTDVFDQTIPLIQDYATAMATASGGTADLKTATIQVGKALQDPIKGITALGKAGVQFNEQQKSQIRGFVEAGRVADAQRIILGELETQFGGSAKAAAEAGLGGFQILQNRMDNLKEAGGELLVEGLEKLEPALDTIVTGIEDFVEAEKAGETATTGFGIALQVMGKFASVGAEVMGFLYSTVARFALLLASGVTQAVEFVTVKFGGLFNVSVDLANKLREFAGLKPLDIKIDIEKFKAGTDKVQKIIDNLLKPKTISPEVEKALEAPAAKGGLALNQPSEEDIKKQTKAREKREKDRLTALEESIKAEGLILENQRINKLISEQEYQEALYQLEKEALVRRADLFLEFGEEQSVKALENQNALDEIRQYEAERQAELDAAELQRIQGLDLQKLDIAKATAEAEKKTRDEVLAYTQKKAEEELANFKQREQRRAAALEEITDARLAVAGDLADGLNALGIENEAFQKGLFLFNKGVAAAEIIINLQREIASIAAANAILGPAGIALTATQTTLAKVRAGIGLATIAATAIIGVARQKKYGGFADVRGADDGQLYHAKLIGQPSTGMLDFPHPVLTSSGILANEVGREYYVSHSDLRNPKVLNHVQAIENITTHRQRAAGGFADIGGRQTVDGGRPATSDPALMQLLQMNAQFLSMLLTKGVQANIGNDEILAMKRQIATLDKASGGRA